MFLPHPYSPEEFALQQTILRRRIRTRRVCGGVIRHDQKRLKDLVKAQLDAENRAERAARREARERDPRQGTLFNGSSNSEAVGQIEVSSNSEAIGQIKGSSNSEAAGQIEGAS